MNTYELEQELDNRDTYDALSDLEFTPDNISDYSVEYEEYIASLEEEDYNDFR